MLQVRDVSVEIGGRTAVEGASFTLRAGDKVGLVGRNGAGKTSLLKTLAGDLPPAGGNIARSGALGSPPPGSAATRRGPGTKRTVAHHLRA